MSGHRATIETAGFVDLVADGTGGDAQASSGGRPACPAATGTGGRARVIASGGTITATNGNYTLSAVSTGGDGPNGGGNAFANPANNQGLVLLETDSGGAFSLTGDLMLEVNSSGGRSTTHAGSSLGGTAQIVAGGGTLSVGGSTFADAFANVGGEGGSIAGGDAAGGELDIVAVSGGLLTLHDYTGNADATGGSRIGVAGSAGNAGGGHVSIRAGGRRQRNRRRQCRPSPPMAGFGGASDSGNGGAGAGGVGVFNGEGGILLGRLAAIQRRWPWAATVLFRAAPGIGGSALVSVTSSTGQ